MYAESRAGRSRRRGRCFLLSIALPLSYMVFLQPWTMTVFDRTELFCVLWSGSVETERAESLQESTFPVYNISSQSN